MVKKGHANCELVIKICSILGHLKYPVLKIFFNIEDLQNKQTLALKLLFH